MEKNATQITEKKKKKRGKGDFSLPSLETSTHAQRHDGHTTGKYKHTGLGDCVGQARNT